LRETADADTSNNDWPRRAVKNRFKLFQEKKKNLMQRVNPKISLGGESQ